MPSRHSSLRQGNAIGPRSAIPLSCLTATTLNRRLTTSSLLCLLGHSQSTKRDGVAISVEIRRAVMTTSRAIELLRLAEAQYLDHTRHVPICGIADGSLCRTSSRSIRTYFPTATTIRYLPSLAPGRRCSSVHLPTSSTPSRYKAQMPTLRRLRSAHRRLSRDTIRASSLSCLREPQWTHSAAIEEVALRALEEGLRAMRGERLAVSTGSSRLALRT